jgi:hypothetical protein
MARFAWINWLFAMGLFFSALGLVTSVARFREEGSPTFRVIFLAVFVVYFGVGVAFWLMPFRPNPRIVPYFARKLEEYGGKTSIAFARGRGLYREVAALDQLAASLGVRPLTDFGFADDYYEQEVHWHPASEGLRTAETLRKGLGPLLLTAPGVVSDLEALASVLCAAADRCVDFSLVLRLRRKDSLQVVMARESRQGSFW